MAPKAAAKVTPRKKTDTVAVEIFEIFFSLQIVSNYHNIKIIMKKTFKKTKFFQSRAKQNLKKNLVKIEISSLNWVSTHY